jgi:hypothetical protein
MKMNLKHINADRGAMPLRAYPGTCFPMFGPPAFTGLKNRGWVKSVDPDIPLPGVTMLLP